MTQGRTPDTLGLFNASRDYCDRTLAENSIYRLLYDQGDAFFPDEFFADLFARRGRHSVPPRVVSTVMVLQRLEGLSDREAVERFMFDARWKYACGGLDADYPGFVHTVLVYMRARLRASENPTRIFDVVLDIARSAGAVGVRRVLDSTPLYDAVATQDTVTLIRSAIRGVLRVCDSATADRVRAVLKRDDSYETPGKPVCDWNDAEAREQLIDELARDGFAVITLFDGEKLGEKLDEALRLLATVLGQDIEEGEDDGLFRIVRGVARDRVISTVDPETRHGHKTASRGFDGYKGHVAIDPDSEIITSTAVTAGNAGDAEVVEELIEDVLVPTEESSESSPRPEAPTNGSSHQRSSVGRLRGYFMRLIAAVGAMAGLGPKPRTLEPELVLASASAVRPEVYGDAAYGAAEVLYLLDEAGIGVFTKVQPPASRGGRFSSAEFDINVAAATVTCPAEITVSLKVRADGSGYARFGPNCEGCPLRERCTTAQAGRTINVHPRFELLHRYRSEQVDPEWQRIYRETRPKVERKLAHMVRRKHGGRRARVRGKERVGHDFSLLGAAVNLARLAQLGLTRTGDGWAVAR